MLGTLRGRAREYEKSAIRIRNFAQLTPLARLNPYELAAKLGMQVISVKDLPNVSDDIAKILLIDKAGEWSGASSGIMQDGTVFIVLNDTQSPQRRLATLMEEICHVLLGHRRNRLSADLLGARDYHQKIEAEAYGVGAAALVPFVGLQLLVEQGLSLAAVARHFGVTKLLVEYRLKIIEE